ncbi:hypothetical protein CH354_16765 [Leptospira levettii]|uniref:hypothetical protein n=1 Tax=Leptospira levettii TaxID=2023178 RepID=UPI000C29A0EE|nr:hypothetical protein [Leptospira levettii]MCW7474903.1 hypothetical protein [Leptospira levettii]PJZ35998.1 hypothetical protein CH354_16765 [Leptospira levettii]PJZ89944.1 hypothetical protein CH368_04090 [Leptospira levettii]PJZ99709.1 hypothetical protein CH369_13065 [Leptospira levettii]
MKQSLVIPILLVSMQCAKTVQVKNQENLFENCMKTFQDEQKCKEFMSNSVKDIQTDEEKREADLAKLTKEQLAGLKLRKEIKDTLPGKNGIFVKEFIGDPDEVKRGGDREYWIYKRPICKFDGESLPDKEITVIFRRSFVEKVEHKKP